MLEVVGYTNLNMQSHGGSCWWLSLLLQRVAPCGGFYAFHVTLPRGDDPILTKIFSNWGGSTCTQHPYKRKALNYQAFTLPETNIALENRSSQKEFHLPTFDFQGLC